MFSAGQYSYVSPPRRHDELIPLSPLSSPLLSATGSICDTPEATLQDDRRGPERKGASGAPKIDG